MIILGLHDGHDAGAALVVDGRLVAAVAEERFTRRKHEATYPEQSIKWCLRHAGLTPADVDRVAMGSIHIPPRYYYLRREATFSIEDFYKEQVEYWKPLLLEGKKPNYRAIFEHRYDSEGFPYDHDLIADEDDDEGMRKARLKLVCENFDIPADRVTFYDHHSCHAWWAYGAMPRMDRPVLVYTTDGAGDGANGTVWLGKPGQPLESLHRTSMCNVGRIYRNMTLLLGMKPAEHEFKVMGLAAYSSERHGKEAYDVFAQTLQNDGLDFVYKEKPSDLYFWFKERLAWHRFDNIAYGLQRRTEELLAQWVRNGIEMTGATDVAFSGGVAQNVKANKAITEIEGLTSLYTPPGPSDESLSIGAAFQDWFAATGKELNSLEPLSSPYLGPEYSDVEIVGALETEELPEDVDIRRVTSHDIAKILASGGVIGRLNGRMEYGPRALGNRSIIADPRNRQVVQVINDYIKQRDFWMPFAPVFWQKG